MIMLDQKIKDAGTGGMAVINSPEGTTFEFQVLQIVIPADLITREIGTEGFDTSSLKLLYSVSDQESV